MSLAIYLGIVVRGCCDEAATMLQTSKSPPVKRVSMIASNTTVQMEAKTSWMQFDMDEIRRGCEEVINTRPSETECGSAVTGLLTFLTSTWAQGLNGELDVGETLFGAGNVVLSGISLFLPITALAGQLLLGWTSTLLGIGQDQSMDDFRRDIMVEVDSKIETARLQDDLADISQELDLISAKLLQLPRQCIGGWTEDQYGFDVCHDQNGVPRDKATMLSDLHALEVECYELGFILRHKTDSSRTNGDNWLVPALTLAPAIAQAHLMTMIMYTEIHPSARGQYMHNYHRIFTGEAPKNSNEPDNWKDWVNDVHQRISDEITDNFRNSAFNGWGNLDPWIGLGTVRLGPGRYQRMCRWHNLQHCSGGGCTSPTWVFGTAPLAEHFANRCNWSTTHQNLGTVTGRRRKRMDNGDWCTWEFIMGQDGHGRRRKYNLCDNIHKHEVKAEIQGNYTQRMDFILQLADGSFCDGDCQEEYNNHIAELQAIADHR